MLVAPFGEILVTTLGVPRRPFGSAALETSEVRRLARAALADDARDLERQRQVAREAVADCMD